MKPQEAHAIAAALPPLTLDAKDAKMLRELAVTLALHHIEGYNALLVSPDGHPDARRWQELRRREGVRVYKERPSVLVPASTDAAINAAKRPNLPVIPSLLMLGSLVGSVEDVLLAAVNTSDESVKLAAHGTSDGLADARLLHVLDAPTAAEPFTHVGVSWRLYSSRRDFVCLDSTGVATTVRGERIGYAISHSVAFSQLPPLAAHGVERGNRSTCMLFRQTSPNTVECYARGLFDFGAAAAAGDLLAGLALNTLAAQWLASADLPELALAKKLAWRLRQRGPGEIQLLANATKTTTTNRAGQRGRQSGCELCGKSLALARRKRCQLCEGSVCASCAVKKSVRVLLPDGRSVAEKRRRFCARCVSDAAKSDPLAVARAELRPETASSSLSFVVGSDGDSDSDHEGKRTEVEACAL